MARYRLRLYSCAMSTLRAAPEPSAGRLTQRVAEEVRAQMARKNVTQVRLAQVLDLPQSSVSTRVRGLKPFTLPELEQLADLFNVHLAVLLGLPVPGPGRPDGDPASAGFEGTRRFAEQLALLSDDTTGDSPINRAALLSRLRVIYSRQCVTLPALGQIGSSTDMPEVPGGPHARQPRRLGELATRLRLLRGNGPHPNRQRQDVAETREAA